MGTYTTTSSAQHLQRDYQEIDGGGAALGAGIIVGGLLAIGIVGYAAPRIGHSIISAARGLGRAIDDIDRTWARYHEIYADEVDSLTGTTRITPRRQETIDGKVTPEEPIIGK